MTNRTSHPHLGARSGCRPTVVIRAETLKLKSEIRNPKSETSPKSEGPKRSAAGANFGAGRPGVFGIRYSDLFRISDFGFRIWQPRLAANLFLLLSALGVFAADRPRIDLAGTWDFYQNVGNAAAGEVTKPPGKIVVPGAWQAQGYGEPGGTIPSANIGPGTSPADYLRHNLMARCLYAREVEVPAQWQGRRVFLCVRRAYRYTDASVNGTRVGDYEGFCSPFEFDITDAVAFGRSNRLALGVDNRPRPGRDTLGTANLYGNWGGIGGAVYLEARPSVWIEDVFAMPKIVAGQVTLRIALRAAKGSLPPGLTLSAEVVPWAETGNPGLSAGQASVPLSTTGSPPWSIDLPVSLAPVRLWSPDDPFLYVARVKLVERGQAQDEVQVRFGMREIRAEGRRLLLNGKPLYLSGYGDDATEPITGMLPADKALYRKRLSLMRSFGFNFVRHHSCVPHDEYFEAADEVGMLVQPEAGLAYTGFWRTGHRLFEQEWPRIVTAFRNHPSIWAWCMGNELFLNELKEQKTNAVSGAASSGAESLSRQQVLAIVANAYRQARELDPTRLVHASDGGTPHEFTDILSQGRSASKPLLLHEYGTYCCSLPDFSLIPRLNGVIRPLTYERAERYVRERRLTEIYPRLYRSSLAMRADAQKHYIESAKASGSNAGYSFWLGVDFPDSPEGCWDEGMLNQLWEPKPGLTETLANYNGPTVLLTTAGLDARSFYTDETKTVGLRLWHYGSRPIADARLSWRVLEGGRILASNEIAGLSCGLGETRSLGEVAIQGLGSAKPRFVTLQAELRNDAGPITQNAWEFYAYPRVSGPEVLPGVYSEGVKVSGAAELKPGQPIPGDTRLLITRELKRERHEALFRAGNAAVLLLGAGGFKETRAGYFLNQHGAGFGGIIEAHPVFASIPHGGRLHLGLYQLIAGGGLLEAETMPAALREGAVVWGLRLTGWISPVKNLHPAAQFCDVMTDTRLHLVLCSLDLLADKPESRYVLRQTIDYLLSGQESPVTRQCASGDLNPLLR